MSMSIANSAPAAKRKRGDEDVKTTPGGFEFERDAEFWLEDGNLVLVARDTGFRVYRGLLASQSEVFGGMFEAASPSTGDSFDGCPVVHLSGDAPEDLRHLLRVILPKTQRRFSAQPKKDITFGQLSAIARLAHKYNIADLETQASAMLQSAYVPKYSELDRLQALRKLGETAPADGGDNYVFDDICAIGAVNCARLLDQPSVLPYAMYICCGLGGRVLDGWTREDGTVERLSTEDTKRIMDACELLAQHAQRAFFTIFKLAPCKGACDTPEDCTDALAQILTAAGRSIGTRRTHDTLHSWEAEIKAMSSRTDLCQVCEDVMVIHSEQERQKAWKLLPHFFGIDMLLGLS
ncbi:hypothetical protein C2E23DRAFT_882240 [Lenzites betulinus]|nr:hypothetical protein C2E23DRAFT_882240 [Lenzites betulinus]